MSDKETKELKEMIEKNRQRLQMELSRKGDAYDADKVLDLSRHLDELIVKYEQAIMDKNK